MASQTKPFPLFAFLLSVCLTSGVHAQTTTSGALVGVVTDASRAVITDVDVEIKDVAKGAIQATKTDRLGAYSFSFLPPGQYTLTIRHAGFRGEKRMVNVVLGPPVSVNISLEIAKVETTLNVTGEVPLIQAENGDASATINQKQVGELPNPGNDLTYAVQTAPGVVMDTDVQGFAAFSILGMPGFSYLHTMDGMNGNDNSLNLNVAGPLNLLLGQNQVQETTVVTSGYSGQFGGAAGYSQCRYRHSDTASVSLGERQHD